MNTIQKELVTTDEETLFKRERKAKIDQQITNINIFQPEIA